MHEHVELITVMVPVWTGDAQNLDSFSQDGHQSDSTVSNCSHQHMMIWMESLSLCYHVLSSVAAHPTVNHRADL